MSMTPDQIYQLSSIGQIPAETDISAIARSFLDCDGYPSMYGGVYRKNGTCNIPSVGNGGIQVDMSSALSAGVGAWKRLRVVVIVGVNGTGGWKIRCNYTNGTSTSATSKDLTGSGDNNIAGYMYCWTATASNFSRNAKFSLSHLSYGDAAAVYLPARYAVIAFPAAYGRTVDG